MSISLSREAKRKKIKPQMDRINADKIRDNSKFLLCIHLRPSAVKKFLI